LTIQKVGENIGRLPDHAQVGEGQLRKPNPPEIPQFDESAQARTIETTIPLLKANPTGSRIPCVLSKALNRQVYPWQMPSPFEFRAKQLRHNRFWIQTNKALFVRHPAQHPSPSMALNYYKRPFSKPVLVGRELSVLVKDLGRFGNAVQRLSNAIVLGQILGSSTVLITQVGDKGSYFNFMNATAPTAQTMGFSLGHDDWREPNCPTALVERNHYRKIEDELIPAKAKIEALGNLRVLFSNLPTPVQYPESSLGIHIRSGDVFVRKNLGNWGQPPLAFYKTVISSRSWRDVTIVSEDLSNPVIGPLISYLRESKISFAFQSGSLAEDLGHLLGFRNLVVGRGTFGPAVVALSPNVDTVYFFEDRFSPSIPNKVERLFRVSDNLGDYRRSVLSGNWKNEADQKKLMVTYDTSALTMQRIL